MLTAEHCGAGRSALTFNCMSACLSLILHMAAQLGCRHLAACRLPVLSCILLDFIAFLEPGQVKDGLHAAANGCTHAAPLLSRQLLLVCTWQPRLGGAVLAVVLEYPDALATTLKHSSAVSPLKCCCALSTCFRHWCPVGV